MADPHGAAASTTAPGSTPHQGEGEEKEEEEPKVLESLLLSVAHHWSLRETVDRQVELVERHFRQDEMVSSMRKLAAMVGPTCPKVSDRQGGANKTATRLQAEDLVNTLRKLGDLAMLPRLMVQSDDLPRILPLLGAVSIGDERGVAARLEALEVAHSQEMKEVRRMVEAVARCALPATRQDAAATNTATRPEVVVTGPLATAVSKDRLAAAAVPPSANPAWPGLPVPGATASNQASFYSNRPPARVTGRRHLVAGQEAGHRERSHSAKRTRTNSEGEFRNQGRPRKQRTRAKGATGTGPDLEGLTDLTGPIEWYIGNTHPNQTEETVKETLTKYAEHHKVTNFTVEKVTTLTKEPNPRNKSWKIVLPARLKEVMENTEMFPRGWITRPFTTYSGPRRQEREGQQPRGPPLATGRQEEGRQQQEQQGDVVAAASGEELVA